MSAESRSSRHRNLWASLALALCAALSCGWVDGAASTHASGLELVERFTSGHRVGAADAKVNSGFVPLDSIAPRERAPEGPDNKRLGGRKRAKAPVVRIGILAIPGIPTDVIRRIVRQNYGRYRLCYEKGLERRPDLQGDVEVQFVIDLDGKPSHSRDGGSALPDAGVVRCMVDTVKGLAFPKPRGPWAAPGGGPMPVTLHLGLRLQ